MACVSLNIFLFVYVDAIMCCYRETQSKEDLTLGPKEIFIKFSFSFISI